MECRPHGHFSNALALAVLYDWTSHGQSGCGHPQLHSAQDCPVSTPSRATAVLRTCRGESMLPGRNVASFPGTNRPTHNRPSSSAPEAKLLSTPAPEPSVLSSLPGSWEGLRKMGELTGNIGLPLQTHLRNPGDPWRHWIWPAVVKWVWKSLRSRGPLRHGLLDKMHLNGSPLPSGARVGSLHLALHNTEPLNPVQGP